VPRALFESKNLIGDSICISAALRQWHAEHPDYQIDLLTMNDHSAELYRGMGVPVNIIFERIGLDYDFEFTFNVSEAFAICERDQCHMAEGYAKLLGVQIEDIGPFYEPPIVAEDDEWVNQVPENTILFAPFSNSCTSHSGMPPNKCLPWPKWKPIIKYMRSKSTMPIRVTGSKKERADELSFSEEEYLTGIPLRPLARAMREGKIAMVVSVDNGISHLAGSQKVPQILFYPMVLGMHYAVPWSNPFVIPIHIDPAMAEPAQLLWSFRQAWDLIMNSKKDGQLNGTILSG